MTAPYVGNADYRGYLNYLGTQGDAQAKSLITGGGNNLGYASNTGSLTNSTLLNPNLVNANTKFYQQFQQLNSPGSIYGNSPAPVYAPKLDVAALSAQARSAAENAVNPFYTKQLNDFLAQQGAQKQQQQAQYETNVKNIQDTLANTLQGNETTRGRTTQDVATNEAQIAQNTDQMQTDTGQAFDASRLAQARQTSTGGLGQQQQETAQLQRNTTEGRQVQAFQQAKDQQELFKGRTMEDLLKSDTLAGTASTKGQAQAKFDLDSYIQNAGFAEQAQRNTLEQQRLQAVGQEQGNQAKLRFNQYLAGISNPAQYAAAVSTYGGAF